MKQILKNSGLQHQDFIFHSDFYEIKFLHNEDSADIIRGWNENFCITYIRSGNFLFNLFRHNYDLHTGCILLDKPQSHFQVQPATGQCTIIRFYPQFYQTILQNSKDKNLSLLANENLLSLSLRGSPTLDYLHYRIFETRHTMQQLEMDVLVIDFLNSVISIINNDTRQINYKTHLVKKYHVPVAELAKEYMCRHMTEDISLSQIATYACTSPFHFSRIFKQLTSFSPYHYLLNLRLAKGEHLLKSGSMPVNEIATLSGFRTPEYFATSFKRKFNKTPSEYRTFLQAC